MGGASATRFVLIGGFLGAGKTTALLRLARHYADAGKRVGIIANDQASGLVDTTLYRAAGFATEEVPDGCFCCRFDELIAAAGRLQDGLRPDVLLAEPTGSCTDLVATVIRPLEDLYGDRFRVAPYVTLLDPDRAYDALSGRGGFSAKVTYIYKMQQHEAAAVVLNKMDRVDADRAAELKALVARNFPQARVIAASARTGAGFDRILSVLEAGYPAHTVTDVDYAVYAAGEERLGWLNGVLDVTAQSPFRADEFLNSCARTIRDEFRRIGREPAHIKILLGAAGEQAGVSLTDSRRDPEVLCSTDATVERATMTINARAECGPELLGETVCHALDRAAAIAGVTVRWIERREFAPAAPRPNHRYRE